MKASQPAEQTPMVVGLDIGHSAVKAAANGGIQFSFPSIAGVAIEIDDPGERALAAKETVTVGRADYFFGETALLQCGSGIATGLSEDWIETPEYSALLQGGLKKLAEKGLCSDSQFILVLGLPAKFHHRQRKQAEEIARQFAPNATIRVLPQPYGPYQKLMTDENGFPSKRHDMSQEEWAVVEIGYYTTDFTLIRKTRPIQRGSDSCSGMRVAAENLQRMFEKERIKTDLYGATIALETRQVRMWNRMIDVAAQVDKALAPLIATITDKAEQLWSDNIHAINGVIIAGGAASLVYPALRQKWEHVIVEQNPRFAVAEGFRRYGNMIANAAAVAA